MIQKIHFASDSFKLHRDLVHFSTGMDSAGALSTPLKNVRLFLSIPSSG